MICGTKNLFTSMSNIGRFVSLSCIQNDSIIWYGKSSLSMSIPLGVSENSRSSGFFLVRSAVVKAATTIKSAKRMLLNKTATTAEEKATIPNAQNQSGVFSVWLCSYDLHTISRGIDIVYRIILKIGGQHTHK